jgi:glucose/arabinose dehydrogenase
MTSTFVSMHRRSPLLVVTLVAVLLTAIVCTSALAGADSQPSSPAVERSANAAPRANLAAARVRLKLEASGLVDPIAIAWRAGDPRMYVAEQGGHVRIVDHGRVTGTSLTLAVSHGNEQGLLGLSFAHDGSKMYVNYTDVNGDSRVVEYTMNGARAVSPRQLLFQPQPYANHNGGQVTLAADNLLYIGFGDGGSGGDPQGNAQNKNTWLGKILRIDPRPRSGGAYRIPPGNPFRGVAGARPEVWMYGLRNPWRFSLDRLTGDVWIGDVGQKNFEEINYALKGRSGLNFGWNRREGAHPYNGGTQPPGARNPLVERTHATGDCAIVGGYVYRGTVIGALRGAYLYGDFCTGQVRAVVQTSGTVKQHKSLGLHVPQMSTFAQGPKGELRVVSHNGNIYLIVPV